MDTSLSLHDIGAKDNHGRGFILPRNLEVEGVMPTRRTFLTTAAGIGASVIAPAPLLAQASRQELPTAPVRAFMSKYGLKYPVLQAPSGGQELAAAISNAGGIGAFALWRTSPETARQNVETMRTRTKKPFIVNYVLTFEPESVPAAVDAGAPIVQFSWGIPAAATVAAIRWAGATFGVQVATPDGARAAVDAGAAYLVAQGVEAGGHVQSSTPLKELLPRVLAEARDVPVLVAGGVSTGAQMRQAMLDGAAGVLMGTRFMATQESSAHADYKSALTHAKAGDAALSVCFSDSWESATHRCLRNGTLTRWEAAGCPPRGRRPGEGDVVATGANGRKVMRYSIAPPQRDMTGNVTDLAMYAGQGVGDIKDIPTVDALLTRMWAECLQHA
jgi:nitronate monooxygenase